jgi:hypothetical protein
MKHVRMLGLTMAVVFPLIIGCKSDDDPISGTGGIGSVGGNSSGQDTGGENFGGNTSDQATGGGGAGGTSAASTIPDVDSGTLDRVPAIAGSYNDGYQNQYISEGIWRIDTSVFHITVLNNAQEFLIASNDSNNDYFPGKWSRFDWTRDASGGLYYCQTAYGAESEQAAQDTTRPNPQDLAEGCGNFAWTKLTPIGDADAGS